MAILKLALYVNFFHTAGSPERAAAGWKETDQRRRIILLVFISSLT